MRLILAVFFWVLAIQPASATSWIVDHDETIIVVDAAYRSGGMVTIRFTDFESEIVFDPKRPRVTKGHISVATRSARTGLFLLDPVVKGRDFLNVRKYPTIEFDLARLVQTGPSDADITGSITFLGVTRPLELKARVFRFRPDEANPADRIASFNISGEIDRAAFGNTARSDTIKTLLPIRIRLTLRPKP